MRNASPTPVPEFPVQQPTVKRCIEYSPAKLSYRVRILYDSGLFTPYRHFLFRRGCEPVPCHYLEDKVVVVMPFLLPSLSCLEELSSRLRDLERVFSHDTRVEFVLAVCFKHEFIYDQIYDHMYDARDTFFRLVAPYPFLAIPFEDFYSRHKVCGSARFPVLKYLESPFTRCAALDMDGRCAALDMDGRWADFDQSLISNYGSDCYPFTKTRLAHLDKGGFVKADPSLTSFLGCQSDTNLGWTKLDGTPVPLSPSDICKGGAAVVFYLYGDGRILDKLHQAYKDCKSEKLELIVVLVYTPFRRDMDTRMDTRSYVKQVNEAMARFIQDDLYVLPLENDELSRKMSRFFYCFYTSPPDELIAWAPGEIDVDPDGAVLLDYYGAAAYPFTKVGFKASIMRKWNNCQLEDLLHSAKITDGAGCEIALSELKGKNTIILNISRVFPNQIKMFYDSRIREWYASMDKNAGSYEVIFVCLGEVESGALEAYRNEMPWLIAQFEDAADVEKLEKFIFELGYGTPTCVVIVNGKVVSLNVYSLISSENKLVLPPTDCTLLSKQVTTTLELRHENDFLMGRFGQDIDYSVVWPR